MSPRVAEALAPASMPENMEPGHNMLKYWLRPVARQGLDSGAGRAPPLMTPLQYPSPKP